MSNYWINQFDDPVDGTGWQVFGDANSPGNHYRVGNRNIIDAYNDAYSKFRKTSVITAMSALNKAFHVGTNHQYGNAVEAARDTFPGKQQPVIEIYLGERSAA